MASAVRPGVPQQGVRPATPAAAQGAGTAAVVPEKDTAIKRMQNNFEKRVDVEVTKLVETFGSIIKASKLNTFSANDKVEASKDKRDNLHLDILIENLILSTESLSQIVYELKQVFVLNDIKTMDNDVQQTIKELTKRKTTTDQKLEALSKEIDEALTELEVEHYSSLQRAFITGTQQETS